LQFLFVVLLGANIEDKNETIISINHSFSAFDSFASDFLEAELANIVCDNAYLPEAEEKSVNLKDSTYLLRDLSVAKGYSAHLKSTDKLTLTVIDNETGKKMFKTNVDPVNMGEDEDEETITYFLEFEVSGNRTSCHIELK
jgi:hypothetical protein